MDKLSGIVVTIGAALALVFVGACDDDDEDVIGDRGEAGLMVINASPDAPELQVFIDNTELVSQLHYPGNTLYRMVDVGEHVVTIEEAGTGTPTLLRDTVNIGAGVFSLLATGAADNLELLFVDDNVSRPDSNTLKMRVVHSSPDAGPIDVTLTNPDGDSLLFSDVSFREATAFREAEGNSNAVVVEAAGSEIELVSLDETDLSLQQGRIYTLYLMGFRQGVGPEQLIGRVVENTLP